MLALGGLTKPGAVSVKENKNRIDAPMAPVRGVAVGMRRILKVKTTLGNGYLGSRIDEERSEMRYLV